MWNSGDQDAEIVQLSEHAKTLKNIFNKAVVDPFLLIKKTGQYPCTCVIEHKKQTYLYSQIKKNKCIRDASSIVQVICKRSNKNIFLTDFVPDFGCWPF